MINITAKIHDRFSIEFKLGFVGRRKAQKNSFAVNTWIFAPNSLDINPLTYTKTHFYRDMKSYIRLITPVFLLREIAEGEKVPVKNLEEAFRKTAGDPTRSAIHDYEYQIKMFAAIFKSAIRDDTLHILNNQIEEDTDYLIESYVKSIRKILSTYRGLRRIINVPTILPEFLDYYFFGDEYISNLTEQRACFLAGYLQKKGARRHEKSIALLTSLYEDEATYRKEKGYTVVEKDSPTLNREYIFRRSILKKYVESDLFLQAKKKRDGVVVEQIYYSLAAGLSMIFATAIAFSFQMKYGNFTMPLFVALVVSYMLKDRIKELMRYYFAHRLGGKYFDNKTEMTLKNTVIGWSKEGMDFISEDKVPREVMDIRNRSPLVETENRINDEKIILYRKLVKIDRNKADTGNDYPFSGINDIMRLHLARFMQKADNPEESLYYLNPNGEAAVIQGEKVYYINMVMQLQFEDQINYKRFRIVFTQAGIVELDVQETSRNDAGKV